MKLLAPSPKKAAPVQTAVAPVAPPKPVAPIETPAPEPVEPTLTTSTKANERLKKAGSSKRKNQSLSRTKTTLGSSDEVMTA